MPLDFAQINRRQVIDQLAREFVPAILQGKIVHVSTAPTANEQDVATAISRFAFTLAEVMLDESEARSEARANPDPATPDSRT